MTAGLRQLKDVTDRLTVQERRRHTDGRPPGMVRQRDREKTSDMRRRKNDIEVQDLETEETTGTEHLLGWQSEEEKEIYQLNERRNKSSLRETEELAFEEPDQSRMQQKMKVKRLKEPWEDRQRQTELEQIKALEREGKWREGERLREVESEVEKEEIQREKERLEELVIERMRLRQMGQHTLMKEQKKEKLRERNQNREWNEGGREAIDVRRLEERRKLLDEAEQGEERFREVESEIVSESVQKFRRQVRRLLEEKQRESDQEAERERKKEAERRDLLGEGETDSQCQEGDKMERQTDMQEEGEERSLDIHEDDGLSLTDAEETSEYSKNLEEDEIPSEYNVEVPHREKSVRGRLIGWVNDKMKERYHRKIDRSIQRETQEGHEIYVSGKFQNLSSFKKKKTV